VKDNSNAVASESPDDANVKVSGTQVKENESNHALSAVLDDNEDHAPNPIVGLEFQEGGRGEGSREGALLNQELLNQELLKLRGAISFDRLRYNAALAVNARKTWPPEFVKEADMTQHEKQSLFLV
jgi:hypothetical protein